MNKEKAERCVEITRSLIVLQPIIVVRSYEFENFVHHVSRTFLLEKQIKASPASPDNSDNQDCQVEIGSFGGIEKIEIDIGQLGTLNCEGRNHEAKRIITSVSLRNFDIRNDRTLRLWVAARQAFIGLQTPAP